MYPYNYFLERDEEPVKGDWRVAAVTNYANNLASVEAWKSDGYADPEVYEDQEAIVLAEGWRLANDKEQVVSPLIANTYEEYPDRFWLSFANSTVLVGALSIFMIVVAGGIIAGEFSGGTIKFLLINPVKRSSIFWSKYLTLLLLGMGSLVIIFSLETILNLIINGGNPGISYLDVKNGELVVSPAILYMAKQYLYASVDMFVTATMAFMISSVLRSSAGAIAVSAGMLMGGNTVLMLLFAFGQDWGRYLIFANTNLKSFMFAGQTLGFAVCVIAVYMVVFLLTAYDGFKRREV
jgi:ABC-2 type transport system permease protein